MINEWNDIKCNKCGNTISVHLDNITYREYTWKCEECGNVAMNRKSNLECLY